MAVFRIEKTRDYTVMSNHHLRNAGLSLKSKGLLSMMLSLPEDWNYTTRGLAKICKESTDSIGASLKELERAGYINKTPARDVEPRIQDIAQKLNITDILNKYPYQVSGGQKQRCACARAIINNPKLLLADEPTGALDSHSAQMLLSTIQSINEQLSATILMVTHDAFTASYASRILFLQDGAIFTELRKGNDSRSTFFEKILNVLTMIGGGQSHVC